MKPDPNKTKHKAQYDLIHGKCFELNQIDPRNHAAQSAKLSEIVNAIGKNVTVRTPVWFDMGNVEIGDNCYINHNCKFLDYGGVKLGNNVAISVGVTVIAIDHPVNPLTSEEWEDIPIPVVVEDDVWIGANATLLGPLRIGKGAIIGAGAVVTGDVEAGAVVVGNPAKVLLKANTKDMTP